MQPRKQRITYKWRSDGSIRAYDSLATDKRGVTEGMVYTPHNISPTLLTTPFLILLTNEKTKDSHTRY